MVRTLNQYNGRAVLSRWNDGPLVTVAEWKTYTRLSQPTVPPNWPRGTLFFVQVWL